MQSTSIDQMKSLVEEEKQEIMKSQSVLIDDTTDEEYSKG